MDTNDQTNQSLQSLNKSIRELKSQYSLGMSFLRGVVTGLGSVFGATIVVAGAIWFLGKLEVVPIIGQWLADIAKVVQSELSL